MNVLVLEDESLAADRLCKMIQEYDSNIMITKKLESVDDAVKYLQDEKEIDLAFFDIQLTDGKSFEVFEKVDFNKPVIFTTAYDQYSIDAFKVNSIDYLLKPINAKDLKGALDKYQALSRSNSPIHGIDIEMLRQLLTKANENYKKRFLVKSGSRLHYVSVRDISYFYAEGKLVFAVLRDKNRQFIIDHTLEQLIQELLDPNLFYRINRTFILNLEEISEIKTYKNSRLLVKMISHYDQEMIVSREKVQDFKAWLNQ